MQEQEILNTETGEKEAEALKPKRVKIVKVEIQEVGDKKNKKLVCAVKHPDRDETIQISSVKYESKGKLQVTGLWVNLDEDSKIRKGSALAIFTSISGVKVPKELEGKEVDTTEDEKGYLCFKAY
jgi:hypothetical protein